MGLVRITAGKGANIMEERKDTAKTSSLLNVPECVSSARRLDTEIRLAYSIACRKSAQYISRIWRTNNDSPMSKRDLNLGKWVNNCQIEIFRA